MIHPTGAQRGRQLLEQKGAVQAIEYIKDRQRRTGSSRAAAGYWSNALLTVREARDQMAKTVHTRLDARQEARYTATGSAPQVMNALTTFLTEMITRNVMTAENADQIGAALGVALYKMLSAP